MPVSITNLLTSSRVLKWLWKVIDPMCLLGASLTPCLGRLSLSGRCCVCVPPSSLQVVNSGWTILLTSGVVLLLGPLLVVVRVRLQSSEVWSRTTLWRKLRLTPPFRVLSCTCMVTMGWLMFRRSEYRLFDSMLGSTGIMWLGKQAEPFWRCVLWLSVDRGCIQVVILVTVI